MAKFRWWMLIAVLAAACTHDPYPAPPGNGNGDNPGDTTGGDTKPCHPDTVYYERDIQPILGSNCAKSGCHGQGSAQDGVDLTSYQSVMQTADVRPGRDPEDSDLYEMITEDDPDKRMPPPPNDPLSREEIDRIAKWIRQGAQNLSCDDCDTADLRYEDPIAGIVEQNCLNCHSGANAQAGRQLDSYENLKDALNNTNLRQRIAGESGVPVMPPNGPMDPCFIESILQWYEEDMPR